MAFELYEHNQKAYDALEKMLLEHKKGCVIHPTGTGKSFIAIHLAKNHPKETFLWLSPSEYIYRVQLKNFREQLGDEDVAPNITFRSYTWLCFHMDVIEHIRADYIILDEFHRCGAKEWEKSVRKLIASNPNAKLVGLSATNIRYLDRQRDMAMELFGGYVASKMDLAGTIALGILPPPKYITSVYSYEDQILHYQKRIMGIKDSNKKNCCLSLIERIRKSMNRAMGVGAILEKYMENRCGKYIVFCINVTHLKKMESCVRQWVSHIDESPHIYKVYCENTHSMQELERFHTDDSLHLKMLLAINSLNEGVHVKDVDGVIMLRPTVSPTIFQQQIGRALAAGKKEHPLIFDIVDNFGNLDGIMELKDYVQYATNYYYPGDGDHYDAISQFTVIDEVNEARELFALLQHTLDASWDDYYEAACTYKETYGHLCVPKHYETEDGIRLGAWIMRQRSYYHEKGRYSLTPERYEKLSAIGMEWKNHNDVLFEMGMHAIRIFYLQHHHSNVPCGYVDKEGYNLGNWVQSIRLRYRKDLLNEEQIDALENVDFVWNTSEEYWNLMIEAARQYYEEHGDLNAAKSYQTKDGIKLGAWLSWQRKHYHNGTIAEWKIEALNQLNMQWESQKEDSFLEHVQMLKEYVIAYGDAKVPCFYKTEGGAALGNWVALMRNKYKRGLLSAEQIEALNNCHMVWTIQNRSKESAEQKENKWMAHYEAAKAYFEANGHLYIPEKYVSTEGYHLHAWLNKQRKLARTNDITEKLSYEKIMLLSKIGMDFMTYRERQWENAYAHAADYYEMFGDIDIPATYEDDDGFRIGKWLKEQKNRYQNNDPALTAFQIRRLEELDIDWDF